MVVSVVSCCTRIKVAFTSAFPFKVEARVDACLFFYWARARRSHAPV